MGAKGDQNKKKSLLLLVVAEVVKKSVNSHIEDIRIPNYSDIKEPSWKGVSDFVFIPKKTVMNAKGRLTCITCWDRLLPSDDVLGHNDAHSLKGNAL